MPNERPVLVHYHIFKNAGTSIDESLRRSFGDAWRTFEGAHATDVLPAARLRTFLEAGPDLRAVSSHLARPPLPWPACCPIVLLRHPLDRARSVFEFVCADRTQPGSDLARRVGFSGYLQWAMNGGHGGVVILNYQTVHLSSASFRAGSVLNARPADGDLDDACALLDSCDAVGLVDQFGPSIALFQQAYGRSFPELRLEPHWCNRTRSHTGTLAQRVAEMRQELGEALFERFLDKNRLDFALYAFARERFTRLCVQHCIPLSRPSSADLPPLGAVLGEVAVAHLPFERP